jgi:hypothetical protein
VQSQLSVEAPTANNRAIFHLTTVRFPDANICDTDINGTAAWGWNFCGESGTHSNSQGNPNYPGKNILGTSMWVDMERTYTMTRPTTGRVTSHMQVDQIDVDFGFITNAGPKYINVLTI